MALPFFYEPTINSQLKQFVLSAETHHHCVQVLRMKEGEAIQLTDGKGLLLTASITIIHKKQTIVDITALQQTPPSDKKICLAVSLLKNASRFEWMLEKATELGVTEIYPLLSNRTERQHFRFDRMQGIVIAAMLQSQQTYLPVLHQPTKAEQLITESAYQQKLIAHCEEATRTPLHTLAIDTSTQILIGPEGDFTPQEIELALQHQFQPVLLGNTRLRTETAAIAAATILCMR